MSSNGDDKELIAAMSWANAAAVVTGIGHLMDKDPQEISDALAVAGEMHRDVVRRYKERRTDEEND